ncbi:MAG: sel1 repeat family protein [Planctomycetales bacterium]|nr:sel1 repeat family protein [bacterium]UNM06969.1 MAG: sel1 repeat family protein [Planctomycetales bacterium]
MDRKIFVGMCSALLVLVLVVIGMLLWMQQKGTFSLANLILAPQQQDAMQLQNSSDWQLREDAVWMYYGIGQPVDDEQAEQMLRRGYAQGDMLAGGHLYTLLVGADDGPNRLVEADEIFYESYPVLYELSENGNVEASFLLAWIYFGSDDPQWSDFCRNAARNAAQAHYVPGLQLYGYMLREGKHVERDPADAMQWYRISAQQGCIYGRLGMAEVYADVDYPNYDVTEALRILDEVVQEGELSAHKQIGEIHELGNGVAVDRELARQHYELAIADGDVEARLKLARCLLRSDAPSAADIEEAAELLLQVDELWSLVPEDRRGDTDERKLLVELQAEVEKLESGQ